MSDESNPLSLTVPEVVIERIAERAAEIALGRLSDAASVSPYATVGEAAEFLRCDRQRIYDLCSARRLTRYKDGSRVLVSRAELGAHLRGSRPGRIVPVLSPTAGPRLAKGPAG